ncbi:hypothetical protein HHI36_000648 [Cryptolaemus montrouzieri]|uniref:Uncharacterized protein n=1 Tax=Cryptolaemus montrouzieri TaxID=559131 RepID=A0ABD2P5X1_9CUCU
MILNNKTLLFEEDKQEGAIDQTITITLFSRGQIVRISQRCGFNKKAQFGILHTAVSSAIPFFLILFTNGSNTLESTRLGIDHSKSGIISPKISINRHHPNDSSKINKKRRSLLGVIDPTITAIFVA